MPRTDNTQSPMYSRINLDITSGMQREFQDLSRVPETAPGLQVARQEQFRGQDAPSAWEVKPTGADEFMRFLQLGVGYYTAGAGFAQSFISLKASQDEALELEAVEKTNKALNNDSIDDQQRRMDIESYWKDAANRAYTTSAINRFNGIAAGERVKIRKHDDEQEWYDIMAEAAKELSNLDPAGATEWLQGAKTRLRPNNQTTMDNHITQHEVKTLQQQNALQHDIIKTATEAALQTMTPLEKAQADPEIVTAQIIENLVENNDFPANFFNPEENGVGAYVVNGMVSQDLSRAKVQQTASDRITEQSLAVSNYVTSGDVGGVVGLFEDPTRSSFTVLNDALVSLTKQGMSGYEFLQRVGNYVTSENSGDKTIGLMANILNTMDPVFRQTLTNEENEILDSFLEGVEKGNPDLYAPYLEDIQSITRQALDYTGQLFQNQLDPRGKEVFVGRPTGAGKEPTRVIGEGVTSESGLQQASAFYLSDPESPYYSSMIKGYERSINALASEDIKGVLRTQLKQLAGATDAKTRHELANQFVTAASDVGIPFITPDQISDSVQASMNSVNGFIEGVDLLTPVQTGASFQLAASALAYGSRIVDEGQRSQFFIEMAKSVDAAIGAMGQEHPVIKELMKRGGLRRFTEGEDPEDYYLESLFVMDSFLKTFPSGENRTQLGISHAHYDKMLNFITTSLNHQANKIASGDERFTYNSQSSTLTLTPNNPQALGYVFQQINDIAGTTDSSTGFTPSTKKYFENYMENVDAILGALRSDVAEGTPFVLTEEMVRESGLDNLMKPLRKALQYYGTPENGEGSLNDLNKALREDPQILSLVGALGVHFISNDQIRKKYRERLTTDPRFTEIVSKEIASLLTPSEETTPTSGRFNDAIEFFYRPLGGMDFSRGVSGMSNKTPTEVTGLLGLNGQNALRTDVGFLGEIANAFSYMWSEEGGTAFDYIPISSTPYDTPSITAVQGMLGVSLEANEENSVELDGEAFNFIGQVVTSLETALSANPITAEVLAENRYNRLEKQFASAHAEANGVQTNQADLMIEGLLNSLPPGVKIRGRVRYDAGTPEEKTGYDIVRDVTGSGRDDRARIEWTIQTGLGVEGSSPSRIEFIPNSPLIRHRAREVTNTLRNNFNLSFENENDLVNRELTIVPRPYVQWVRNTITSELENNGIDLEYKPDESSSSLRELIYEMTDDNLNVVRDRHGNGMVSISPVSRASSVEIGINGLTADNLTIFGLLVEERLAEGGSEFGPLSPEQTTERMYDFILDLQKEATSGQVNQEQIVSPLGVLVYTDDRKRMSVILSDKVAEKSKGRTLVQPTSEQLSKYREKEMFRDPSKRQLQDIMPRYGVTPRYLISEWGYPRSVLTDPIYEEKARESAYRQMR